MLLCFVVRCSVGNIVTIMSYLGQPARWSTPSGSPLIVYMYTFFIFMANKRCCCMMDRIVL